MGLKQVHRRTVESVRNPAIGFGTTFAAGMAFFTYQGWKADQRFGTGQACTLGGAVLGLVFGAYEVWKLVRRPAEQPPKPPASNPPPDQNA